MTALPAIVAELTTALAAAPAARVLAVGHELPGALRELARALLQGGDPEGPPAGQGGDQRAQREANAHTPPAASGEEAPAGNTAAPAGEPALAAAPGSQEGLQRRSGCLAGEAAASNEVGAKSAAVSGCPQPVVVPRLDLSRCADGQRPGAGSSGPPDMAPAPDLGPVRLGTALPAADSGGLDVRARGCGARQGPAASRGGEERTRAASLLRRTLFPARGSAAPASSVRGDPRGRVQPEGPPGQARAGPAALDAGAPGASQAPTVMALEPQAAPRGGRSRPRSWWRGLFGRAPEPWVDAAGVRWRHNAAAARGRGAAPVPAHSPDLATAPPGAGAVHGAAAGAGAAGWATGPASRAPAPAASARQGPEVVGAAAETGAGTGPDAALGLARPREPGAAVSHAPGGVAWRKNAVAEAMPDADCAAGGGSAMSTLASSGADGLAAELQEPGSGAPVASATAGHPAALEGCTVAAVAIPVSASGQARSAGREDAPRGSVGAHTPGEGQAHGSSGQPGVLCGIRELLAYAYAAVAAEGVAAGGAAGASTPDADPAVSPETAKAVSAGVGGRGGSQRQPACGSKAVDTLDLHANPMIGLDLGELMSTGGECVGRGRLSSAGEAFLAAMFEGAAPHPGPKPRVPAAAHPALVCALASAEPVRASSGAAQPPGSSADGRPGLGADAQGGPKAASSQAPIEGDSDPRSLPRSAGAVSGGCGGQARKALEAFEGPARRRAEGARLPSTGSSAEGPWASDWALGSAPGLSLQAGLPQPLAEQHASQCAVEDEPGVVNGPSGADCGTKTDASERQGKAAGSPSGASPLSSSISIVASCSALPQAPGLNSADGDPVTSPAGGSGMAAGQSIGRPPRSPEQPQRRAGMGYGRGSCSSAAALASADPAAGVAHVARTQDAAAAAARAGGQLGSGEACGPGAGSEDGEALTPVHARVQQLNAQLQCAQTAGLGSGVAPGPGLAAAMPRRSLSDEGPRGAEPGTSPRGRWGAQTEGTGVLAMGVRGTDRRPPPGPRRCSSLSLPSHAPQGPDPTPHFSCQTPGPVQAGALSKGRERSPSPHPDPKQAGAPFACRVSPGVVAAAIAAGSLPLRRATAAGPDGAAVGRMVAVVPYAALRGARLACCAFAVLEGASANADTFLGPVPVISLGGALSGMLAYFLGFVAAG